jgi:hypothetical protein
MYPAYYTYPAYVAPVMGVPIVPPVYLPSRGLCHAPDAYAYPVDSGYGSDPGVYYASSSGGALW